MNGQQLVGLDYLHAVTTLLQRSRLAHPSHALYEAAELQFWWNKPRRSDDLGQLFWFDDDGQPVAAAIMVDFTGGPSILYKQVTFCPFVMPDTPPDQIAHILDRGLAHAAENGFESVEIEVGNIDEVMKGLLSDRGFQMTDENMLVECRMDADARAEVSSLHEGYRLASRAELSDRPHHMAERNGPDLEERLNQMTLYRSDLDLAVFDADENLAALGMFWYDPTTSIGVVEPMRTMDDHQQKGLARHILTAGLDRLAKAGATRLAIGYDPSHPASGHLYRSVGFVPGETTDLWSGPTVQS